jgi:hypothetical protein
VSRAFFERVNARDIRWGVKLFVDYQDVGIPNVVQSGGQFKNGGYGLVTLGPRIEFDYSGPNLGVFEVAPVFLTGAKEFNDDPNVGIRVGFGYQIHLHDTKTATGVRSQYALLKMDKIFGFDRAEAVPERPDIFNGAYLTVGLAFHF